jgi:hypothetical protein
MCKDSAHMYKSNRLVVLDIFSKFHEVYLINKGEIAQTNRYLAKKYIQGIPFF